MVIAILLACYNSENYIEQQLDSIINQSIKNFKVYIKDDGSKDGTLSILDRYEVNYQNIIILRDNLIGRGAMKNFFWILENVDADYYMFSDHDDVWLENKIELSLKEMFKLENENPEKPVIVHTDLKVVDQSLNCINDSFWDYSRVNPILLKSFHYLAVSNGITGCTMLFNQKAKNVSFPIGRFSTMHDAWISLCVANSGGIIGYVKQQTILYRQHLQNAIGANKVGNVSYYIKKISSFNRIIIDNYEKYKMANEIRQLSLLQYLIYKLSYLLNR